MSAGIDPQAESSERTPQQARKQQLAAAVRAAAANAADEVGGGLALIFAAAPGESGIECTSRLRAAAGFSSAQAARDAAQTLLPEVRDALEHRAVGSYGAHPSLGQRGVGGTQVHPLICEDRLHGALVIASPAALDSVGQQKVAARVEGLSLRLDHAHMLEQSAEMSDVLRQVDTKHEDKQEEILKLSEALFAQDIELLRSNEKLNKIEKLKSDFIERMSRELRTPVNGIIESIISVLTGENESLSDTAKASLRRALDDGTGFLRTLQNIIDLWRIQRSELPVEIQDVNFRETVDEAIFSLQDDIEGKPLTVEQQLQEPFPKIRTDLTKINQILFLMLDNAVKFTPQGKIEIAARVNDGRLHCEIRDTGVGICTDDQQYIFDEFYQVDEPASDKYRGAGLGLALVRNLIILLEGEIAVRSEVGAGSTFIFSIPVQVVG